MRNSIITKKQIKLSWDVLTGKKLYNVKSSICYDIEDALLDSEKAIDEENINMYGFMASIGRAYSMYSVCNELRKKGYRIYGDK